jgi:thiamine pyrophosphokinase
MATLNLLAFLFHTTLEIMDSKYQAIRNYLPRETFFDDIRTLTRYICFNSLDELLSFTMKGLELKIDDSG